MFLFFKSKDILLMKQQNAEITSIINYISFDVRSQLDVGVSKSFMFCILHQKKNIAKSYTLCGVWLKSSYRNICIPFSPYMREGTVFLIFFPLKHSIACFTMFGITHGEQNIFRNKLQPCRLTGNFNNKCFAVSYVSSH